MSGLRRAAALAVVAGAVAIAALLAAPAPARAGAAAAEALARTHYHEGIPLDAARAIDAAGAARLAELLADPAEEALHAQVVELLGMSGRPEAYACVQHFAAGLPRRAVDHETFRKQVAVRIALGYLARSDDRALAELVAEASSRLPAPSDGSAPAQATRRAQGLRRAAVSGLGLSGRAQAASVLRRLAGDLRRGRVPADDPELARHVASALAMHARVAGVGAAELQRGQP